LFGCKENTEYRKLYKLANIETDNEKYDKAIKLLDQVITLKPNFDSAYTERSYNYLFTDKIDLALLDANKAIELAPNNKCALYYRGMIYEYLNENNNAIADYSNIIDTNDSVYTEVALSQRAEIYFNIFESVKSIQDYSKLIILDSFNAELYLKRGISKRNNDITSLMKDSINTKFFTLNYCVDTIINDEFIFDTKGALNDFTTAIKLDPELAFAYYNRGKVYDDLKQLDRALSDFNLAIELDENDKYILARALIYKDKGELALSLNDFDLAISLNPENGFAYANRGYLKKNQLNDTAGATKDFEIAEEYGVLAE
jgi:tetratricopeptide (TPR) repeat protein